MKRARGEIVSLIAMILIPLTALGLLYYCLETYTRFVHNDSGTFVGAYTILCMAANIILWVKNRRKGKIFTVIAAVSLLLLAGVLLISGKIPFCVECDQVTAEDLGFLTRWIPPMDT